MKEGKAICLLGVDSSLLASAKSVFRSAEADGNEMDGVYSDSFIGLVIDSSLLASAKSVLSVC